MTVFPELLAGRDDAFVTKPWTIEEGSALRGGASCNLTNRVLRVPLGDLAIERTVRTHELVHARVSPHRPEHAVLPFDVHPRAAECAEEFRVNALLGKLSFDTAALCDGSEKVAGARVAESGQWHEAVCFLLAVLGTGGAKPFLGGVRSHQPTWIAPLRAIAKQAEDLVRSVPVRELGSTRLTGEGAPEGWSRFTLPIAKMVSGAMQSTPPQSTEDLRRFKRSLQPGARRAPTGKFAPLVLADGSAANPTKRRSSVRRVRPQVSGVVLTYPQRFLTDPLVRVYGRKARTRGGVVVIDQSGSMDVSSDDVRSVLAHAPHALIVGYSHRPGDQGETPNAWILADAHGVVADPPSGNIGNGVDGPVLRWALQLRRRGEPMVWVTDGQVTDSHDHPCDSLSLECAALVQRERITLARTLEGVPAALRGQRATPGDFGRVGRKIQELSKLGSSS